MGLDMLMMIEVELDNRGQGIIWPLFVVVSEADRGTRKCSGSADDTLLRYLMINCASFLLLSEWFLILVALFTCGNLHELCMGFSTLFVGAGIISFLSFYFNGCTIWTAFEIHTHFSMLLWVDKVIDVYFENVLNANFLNGI